PARERDVVVQTELGTELTQALELGAAADQREVNVAPALSMDDVPGRGQQQVDALLLADDSDVADEKSLAESPLRLGREHPHPLQRGPAANDGDVRRRLSAPLDRNPSVRLVRCDRAV